MPTSLEWFNNSLAMLQSILTSDYFRGHLLVAFFNLSFKLMWLIPPRGVLGSEKNRWFLDNIKPRYFGARKFITMADLYLSYAFMSPASPLVSDMIRTVQLKQIFVIPFPYAFHYRPLNLRFWTMNTVQNRLRPCFEKEEVLIVSVDGGYRLPKGGFFGWIYKLAASLMRFWLFSWLSIFVRAPASAAAVFREESGDVLHGIFQAIHARDSVEAEMFALCMGMNHVLKNQDLQTYHIVVEMDNKTIVENLPFSQLFGTGYVSLTLYQRFLHDRFSHVDYRHVRREKNQAADFLAKYAMENLNVGPSSNINEESFKNSNAFHDFEEHVKINWGGYCFEQD